MCSPSCCTVCPRMREPGPAETSGMRDSHRVVRPSILYVGTPAFLIATVNDDGTPNLAPASSYWALGQLMVIGLETDGQSSENLARRPELTVSFPSPEHWMAVERLAEATGRHPVPEAKADRYGHVPDKFGLAGLHAHASDLVAPPRVEECALQFEARVRRLTPGVEPGYVIVEAEVVRVHADPRIVVPGTDRIDPLAWQPIVYSFRHYFGIGEPLGARGVHPDGDAGTAAARAEAEASGAERSGAEASEAEPSGAEASAEEPAGDAACWLPRVCAECGALVEGSLPASCWRCGALVGT